MPQNNYITDLLDLKDFNVEKVESDDKNIFLYLSMKVKPQICPNCSHPTEYVHDYREQRVKDLPIQGKNTIWYYRKRRYRCPNCGKRFYESNYLLPKWHRITNRTALYCLKVMEKRLSLKDAAEQVGVSASTSNRWLSLVPCSKPDKLPNVLSIDEFRGNAGSEKFQCILTSPVEKKIVDILPSRRSTELISYFDKMPGRDKVEFFIMDMNKAYLEIAKTWFPKAEIIIDRFHFARYCTWAFENVRKRVQKNLFPQDRKYFKRSRKLLLARMISLNDEDKQAVSVMLSYHSDLQNAYYLKEAFYEFMDQKTSDNAKEKLKEFIIKAVTLNLPEFKSCITMLQNWSTYILNSFDYPYSNGYTEGINNTIKVLKRVGFGYRNFDNFRARIMLIANAKSTAC